MGNLDGGQSLIDRLPYVIAACFASVRRPRGGVAHLLTCSRGSCRVRGLQLSKQLGRFVNAQVGYLEGLSEP